MKKTRRFPIRKKLFLLISAVCLINILAITVFGGTFLEGFYKTQKRVEITALRQEIYNKYNSNTADADLVRVITRAERNNNRIILFTFHNNTAAVNYCTMGNSQNDTSNYNPLDEVRTLINSDMFESLVVAPRLHQTEGFIFSYSLLSDNRYLIISSPIEYISSISADAMMFFLVLSLITLFIGLVAAYIISMRISNPIRKIKNVAENVAKLDFSDTLDIKSGDEIGDLAISINTMSSQIKNSIDLLQKDLAREEATNKMRREFITNVSHDFKTPLSLIYAYAEAAGDSTEDELVKEYIQTIIQQSENMSDLVTRLLSLSQLESGLVTFEKQAFALRDVIDTVVSGQRIFAEKQGATVAIDVDPEIVVYSDYKRISQVFTNIHENAIKYTDSNKTIQIKAEMDSDIVKISVINTANHLPEDELAQLFDSFYRFDKSRTGEDDKIKAKSYGVGLAIIKTIIEGLGGEYGAENTWIQGEPAVKFWFTVDLFEE
jgi:Signal transduction histidine kinase